ncbi:MAG: FAD-dependent oxidoreductase [Candidatus Omnitrophica bacterium]|nr:FAD-dependent oxidoreductase [Candidatus Omnitrophota bacterium]
MADDYDVIIIGGGPAGLTAGIYAARTGLYTLVIDKNILAGALGSTSRIENYPGILKPCSGRTLIGKLRRQAQKFGAELVRERVLHTELEGPVKKVVSEAREYRSRSLIVASGAMGRKASVDGEKEFLGKGVSYCAVCDAPFFRGKKVALVGGIEEISQEIGVIAKFASAIYIVSLQAIDSPGKKTIDFADNLTVFTNHRLSKIYGARAVEGVEIISAGGQRKQIAVDGVFMYLHGNRPLVDFLGDHLKTGSDRCLIVNREDMSTSLEGVFAAGDVICTRIRQAVVAASEGCIAALSAEKYIMQRRSPRAQWH